MGDGIRGRVVVSIVDNVADPPDTAVDDERDSELATSPATVVVCSFCSCWLSLPSSTVANNPCFLIWLIRLASGFHDCVTFRASVQLNLIDESIKTKSLEVYRWCSQRHSV